MESPQPAATLEDPSLPPSSRQAAWAIVGVTLLAPALGGTTELWAMATIMALTGVLFLIAPPRHSLPVFPTLLLLALFLLALGAFLPASLSSFPAWRLDLIKLGADLPFTRSPQPWLTLQWSCLLLLVILWSYYLLVFTWTRRLRENALAGFAIGVLFLGAILVVAHVTKQRVPFWPDVPEFGFFPNRNQTSNVFGLAGIVIYAIGLHRLQERRPTWWLWLFSLTLICWALILNYSRAGIILFFGGAFAWHLWWISQARHRRGPTIALAGLALLVGLLLLNGGKTLARFENESGDLVSLQQNGRVQIYRDALHLSKETPLLGIGLGNFRSLFSTARYYSSSTSEAVHPESDWLWGVADLGWLGPLIVLFLVLWWLGHCFPFPPRTARALRIAAMIGGLAFAFHGFFDVSAHRLGTLWPALFLGSIALYPQSEIISSRLVSGSFRAFGMLLLLVSAWWFASIAGEWGPPTSAAVARLEKETEAATTKGDYTMALDRANTGLAVAPLDWLLYYHRGAAEAALFRWRSEISRDFSIARYLFPHWPELYLHEGEVWLAVGEPDLAFPIWEEGIRKLGVNSPMLYDGIFGTVRDDAALRDRWRDLGRDTPRFLLSFLANAAPVEFNLEVARLLTDDPALKSFSPSELQRLFQVWYQNGDRLSLIQTLQQHDEWKKLAWRQLSRALADLQDYRQAYETVERFSSSPVLPEIDPPQLPLIAARFRASHNPGEDGLLLATGQFKTGAMDDALRTIEIASTETKAPLALHYLAAQIWAGKSDWPKAWQAIAKYGRIYD